MLAGMALTAFAFSQTQVGGIQGKIIEQANKQPLIGATAMVLGTSLGTTAVENGFFELQNVPEGRQSLVVSFIGFQEKTLTDVQVVRGKNLYLEIELIEDQTNLNEVTVTTRRFENDPLMPISTTSFNREEIFRNPGAAGDVMRAIGVIPGVSSPGGIYSSIAVRGQGVRDNALFVDDIPVFEIGHLEGNGNGAFNDPNGARYSIFAPRVIDNVVFQGGGFGAQYGRKSAAYLGFGVKEGNLASQFVSGQFDILGGTLIFDGHAGNTGVFATARYLDFGPITRMLDIEEGGLPRLGDFLVKTTSNLGKRNKLTVLAMYNPETFVREVDDLRKAETLENNFLADIARTKSVAGVQLRTLTGSRSYWKNIVYMRTLDNEQFFGYGYPKIDEEYNLIDTDNIPNTPELYHLEDRQQEVGGRSIFTMNWSKVRLTAGVDIAQTQFDYRRTLSQPDTQYVFRSSDFRPSPSTFYNIVTPEFVNASYDEAGFNASAYADFSIKIGAKLTLNPGLRFDRTGFTEENLVSPRLSGNFQLNEKNSLSFATGIYYQDPLMTDIGDQSGSRKLKSERSDHFILGYKNSFAPDWRFSAEVWYKHFENLVTRPNSGQSLLNNDGTGEASGLDLSLSKRFSDKWHGQAAFSLQRSVRNNHDGLGEYDADFSQPVQATLLGSYQLGERWIFSGKFRYATGLPKDAFIIHENVLNDPERLRFAQELTENNADRLEDFISLDLRADYRAQLGKASLTVFLEITDVVDRNNQSAEFFQPISGQTYFVGVGRLPTFGVKVEF